MAPDFKKEAQAIQQGLVSLRRELHQNPELGLDLPWTQQQVLDQLEDLDLEITLGEGLTSVVAVLEGGKPGPAVLLRGDMDGLPIVEETGLDFAATGATMHACGHDMHTAGLVGAAKLLSAHRADLPGNVIFMFQPGEEAFGGGKIMVDEGVLDITGERPIGAYAVHVAPGPAGVFATRPGPMAAGSNKLKVVVHGSGGHGSQPHLTLDPVPVAAEIILALQSLVTRRFDAFNPVIISVTRLEASDATNVIPDKVTMHATVRTLSDTSVEKLQAEVPPLVEHIAMAHGLTAEADFEVMYPVTTNNPETTDEAIAWLREEFGPQRVTVLPNPMMASEDFSFVLKEVPGTFIALASSPPDVDLATAEFNHSPRVLFDDAVLGDQAAALATVAWKKLESETSK